MSTARWRTARQFQETAVHDAPSDTPSEAQRLADTIAMLPANTRCLLDVGCGRGELLRRVSVPFAVGVDMASRGVRCLNRPKAQATIRELPFMDRSFDVVLCAETLEHLDPADVPGAAHELMRVARRSVVVTVPWQEDLLVDSHRCRRCGTVFHLHGHQSSFSERDLRVLFSGAARYEVRGSWRIRRYNHTLLRIRTELFGQWKHSKHGLCPGCGNTDLENYERRFGYRLLGAANGLIHPTRAIYRWMLFHAQL